MKEQIIKNFLSEKKTIAHIFLAVSSIYLVVPLAFIPMALDGTINNNIETAKEVCVLFGSIGVIGLSLTIYFMKFTNKLNVIKMSKEELEKVYDELIDEKTIKSIEENSKRFEIEIQNFKKKNYRLSEIALIIITFISACIMIWCFVYNIKNVIALANLVVFESLVLYLYQRLRIILKTTEELVEEFKFEFITKILSPEIYKRNKKVVKAPKVKQKEYKNKKIKRKNPILFWLIETILLIWCLTAFNRETVYIIENHGIYGVIGIAIVHVIPAFFFIRNIYVRYFKHSKE